MAGSVVRDDGRHNRPDRTFLRRRRLRSARKFVVAGERVRLKGGEIARQVMIDIVADSQLTCVLTGEKMHRRDVGYCTTADGVDINRAIIEQGLALANKITRMARASSA